MTPKRVRTLAWAAAALLLVAACGWLVASRFVGGTALVLEAGLPGAPAAAPRPAARETFYLLDDDLIRLAMAGPGGDGDSARAEVHRRHPRLRILAGLMNARRREAYPLGPDALLLLEQSRPLWEPHVVRAERTDGRGRAVFAGIEPGTYWVVGRAEGDGRFAFWNSRVVVPARGEHRLTLDEKNALAAGRTGGAR